MWHPVTPICPDCHVHSETTCVSFNAQGHVAIEGKCPKCKQFMYIEFTLEEAKRSCQNMDNPASPEYDLANMQVRGKAN